jgi:hypothetical protein
MRRDEKIAKQLGENGGRGRRRGRRGVHASKHARKQASKRVFPPLIDYRQTNWRWRRPARVSSWGSNWRPSAVRYRACVMPPMAHGPWARAYQRVFFKYQKMKRPPPALGLKKNQKNSQVGQLAPGQRTPPRRGGGLVFVFVAGPICNKTPRSAFCGICLFMCWSLVCVSVMSRAAVTCCCALITRCFFFLLHIAFLCTTHCTALSRASSSALGFPLPL